MPGLRFVNLPAYTGDVSPTNVVEQDLTQLKDLYKRRVENIQSQFKGQPMTEDSVAQYKRTIFNLQSEYDVKKANIIKQQNQLQLIQKLIDQGAITSEAGQQAMWRLVLPSETEQAMFPKEPTERIGAAPYSPGQLRAFQPTIEEFAQAAETIPAFWTSRKKEKRTQPELIRQYLGWRQHYGYDDPKMTPTRRKQMDQEWDDYMAGEEFYEWNPRSPEIQALRPTGKLTKAAAPNITPMGQSIINAKPKVEQPKTRQEHLDEYKRLGGSETEEGRKYADKYLK